MFGLLLRAFVFFILPTVLTACGTRPTTEPEVQQIYDIRGVQVVSSIRLPRDLLPGIKVRLERSIQDTVRPAPLPQAFMTVGVTGMTLIPGYDGTRTETQIAVTLSDPATNLPLMARSFVVYSFSISDKDADDSAAEAVAARLRIEYALSQPIIHKIQPTGPQVSTRMTDDTIVPLNADKNRPVIIPMKDATAIGADQDPLLNSKMKIRPAQQTTGQQAVIAPAKAAGQTVEDGAKAKVVIKSKSTEPAADTPCVETMDKKC